MTRRASVSPPHSPLSFTDKCCSCFLQAPDSHRHPSFSFPFNFFSCGCVPVFSYQFPPLLCSVALPFLALLPPEMNLLFRTSGPTTAFVTVLCLASALLLSCAATPNTVDSATTNTSPAPVVNGTTESVSSPAQAAPAPTDHSVSTPSSSSTPPVQNVNSSASQSVTTTVTPTSSLAADTTSSSSPSSPTATSSSVPPVVTPSTSTYTPNTTSTATEATTAASATTQHSSANSTTAPPGLLISETTANSTLLVNSTETANSTANSTTPQTLIYFDPAEGLVIDEPTLAKLVSGNGSKLVIKYVNKVNDALQKQTQKFTFKSTTTETENGTIPKFVAKFLVKNGSGVAEKKFQDFMSDEVTLFSTKCCSVTLIFLLIFS